MNMTTVTLWAALLLLQNASFTWVSRARNGGNDWYHAKAAVFSNGIWFAAQFVTFGFFTQVIESRSVQMGVGLGLIYVGCTVFGSVFAGKFLRTYIEKGDKRVGHYADKGEK